jgi:hypothetical protein
MKFTLVMVLGPIALFVVAGLVSINVSERAGAVFGVAAGLWFWVDLFVLPLYWAARIVRFAWGAGSKGA